MNRIKEPVGEFKAWDLENEQFCFLSLTASPVLAGSHKCPWFCWQLCSGWRPDRPKYLEALVCVLVFNLSSLLHRNFNEHSCLKALHDPMCLKL